MNQEKEYFAFISYKREDEKWAKWLQRKLEHYKLSLNVRKNNDGLPKSLRPVFKDTSELASGVLATEIRQAVESSQYLIAICSPRAAQSEWVCKEVQTFIDLGRSGNIIPFIVGGKAYSKNPSEECFPVTLRQLPQEQELLWNAYTGELYGTLSGHDDCVRNAAFSPDWNYVASASYDKTIKIWDIRSQDSVMTLRSHQKSVCSVSFSPDGRTLASVSWDNAVKLWDFLPLQQLIDQTRERFKTRQLTQEERRKYYLE